MVEEIPKFFENVRTVCEDYALEFGGKESYVEVKNGFRERKIFECYNKKGILLGAVSVGNNIFIGGKPEKLRELVNSVIIFDMGNPNHFDSLE